MFRRLFSISLSAAFLAANFGAAHAQTPVPIAAPAVAATPAKSVKIAVKKPKNQRVEVFEQVWKTVNENYYDPKFKGVNWAAMRAKYLPRAERAAGETQLYSVLDAMLGELKDKHTSVTPPRMQRLLDSGLETSVGLRLTLVEGALAVYRVDAGSDAARAGVRPGMRVVTISGKPVTPAMQRAGRFGPLLWGEPYSLLRLGLAQRNGRVLNVALTRNLVETPEPVFESRLLSSGNAYIKFGEFTTPLGLQVKAALQKFKRAPGLVLDLRDNPGGQQSTELEIAGYFFNKETLIGKRLTRTGKPMSVLWGFIQFLPEMKVGQKGGQLWARPVVVLINHRSASASEALSNALQEQKRAYVIGTRSAGALLGIRGATRLKDGGELRVSEMGFITAKGQTVENRGVIPDQKTPLTFADLRAGRDAALVAADKYLLAQRAVKVR